MTKDKEDHGLHGTPQGEFRCPSPGTPRVNPGAAARTFGPGWITVGICTNPEDLRRLDQAVAELKRAGVRRMSRSWLLRIAMERLDLAAVLVDLKRVGR